MSAPLHALLGAIRAWVAEEAPHVAAFAGSPFEGAWPLADVAPQMLPGPRAFCANPPEPAPSTQPLLGAILAAAPHVTWRQSYTTADGGIDQHHLDTYGWFNLVAPSGPFVSDDLRISVGYWGKGITYPVHAHEPEEIYLTVAGRCTYLTEGRAPLDGGPGTTVCHPSMHPHGFTTDKDAVLVLAFWRGDNLEAKSRIGEAL